MTIDVTVPAKVNLTELAYDLDETQALEAIVQIDLSQQSTVFTYEVIGRLVRDLVLSEDEGKEMRAFLKDLRREIAK